jgi:hypothetical protein
MYVKMTSYAKYIRWKTTYKALIRKQKIMELGETLILVSLFIAIILSCALFLL